MSVLTSNHEKPGKKCILNYFIPNSAKFTIVVVIVVVEVVVVVLVVAVDFI